MSSCLYVWILTKYFKLWIQKKKKDLIIKDNELKAEIFETLKAHKESANSIKRYVDLVFYVTILSIAISAIVIFSMYAKKK